MSYYISPPPQNPLTRIISAIIGIFVLAGAFMLGIVALLVVAAVGLIAGIAIWLRVQWIKRQLQKNGVDLGLSKDAPATSGHIIDAEYTVVSERPNQDRE